MWLLDANMDVNLAPVLSAFGITCDTAANRGWKALSNGELVAAAVQAGFSCLLTRDRSFAVSAGKALRELPRFAVVFVNLPQRPWPKYRDDFVRAWSATPIIAQPGRIIEWPPHPGTTDQSNQ